MDRNLLIKLLAVDRMFQTTDKTLGLGPTNE